jgi:hypothetical protein
MSCHRQHPSTHNIGSRRCYHPLDPRPAHIQTFAIHPVDSPSFEAALGLQTTARSYGLASNAPSRWPPHRECTFHAAIVRPLSERFRKASDHNRLPVGSTAAPVRTMGRRQDRGAGSQMQRGRQACPCSQTRQPPVATSSSGPCVRAQGKREINNSVTRVAQESVQSRRKLTNITERMEWRERERERERGREEGGEEKR